MSAAWCGTLLADVLEPDGWTDERILAALRAWTAETGEPPRSYEWSSTARSLGLYNERTARWERDWPHWPSTDTLRSHFGRFNQALEAAGTARLVARRCSGHAAVRRESRPR